MKKGFAEDRMPAFHSNFEPDTPSARVEHMVAQVNKITSMMARTSTTAGPVPSEMNTPSIIRTDAMIHLEPGVKMDILFLDDPSGKSSQLGRLQRSWNCSFLSSAFAWRRGSTDSFRCRSRIMILETSKGGSKRYVPSLRNISDVYSCYISFKLTSCALNSIPFSYYTLTLALAHKICPDQFEDEMLNFYCETVFPIWQKGATRHLLPNSIIIEAKTFPGALDADLREAHIKFNLKQPLDGVFVSIVQWSSATAPPPGQPDSIYIRTIHCHSREVIKDGHTEIKPTVKKDAPKRRLVYKTLLLG